jgi:sterol desaturase/sphingolipid hydroxylase (fatty acid hydroxylase superfamily)
MSVLIAVAVPFFIVFMVAEAALVRRRSDVRGYEIRDTATSLAMGIGNVVIATGTKAVAYVVFTWAHAYALFDVPTTAWWAWAILIPAEDFCYYWFHRAGHEVRLFWAAHENHHSSRCYNFSTALRQSWTTPFTGPIFWLPLAFIGFDPVMILTAQGISLLYQFLLHTEVVDRLGPLEWVMNTPSHHRVHHGRNIRYLDRNYAGIFIVWDRMFGSFEPEGEPVDYGLTTNIETFNPVRVAFHEWSNMLGQARAATSAREVAGRLFGPPGWSPDGTTLTSREMRASGAQLAS